LAALSRNLTGAGYGVLSLRNSAVGTIQPSTLSVDRTYTLPDATGTIALTSNLLSYVPYTGATTDLNLGSNNFTVLGKVGINTITPKTYSVLTTNGQLIGLNNIAVDLGQSYRFNNYFNTGTGTDRTISTGWSGTISLDQSGAGLTFLTSSSSITADNNVTNTPRMYITGAGNVLINSGVDDTKNKLQVNGSAAFKSAVSITSNNLPTYYGITSYAAQDNSTVTLSTILPNLAYSGTFISLQVQIVATDGGGLINSSIYLCSRTDLNVWTNTLVSTTGVVVPYTFTFGGTGAAPTLAITNATYIYKSVGYQILMR
jgi:hypothetical protein